MSPEIITTTTEFTSFFEEDWISDVLFAVKSGKEATVYCCEAHPCRDAKFFALKVYKPQEHRQFRNDAIYQEGRYAHETREVRAMRNKSKLGRKLQFDAWLAHEFAILSRLVEAGCDVPRPFATSQNAILLEFIASDEDNGQPAPTLSASRLSRSEAEPLLERLLRNVERMLACHVVHGDLSAYNILYGGGRLHIIDFPQAIDPRFNQNAQTLFYRDVKNICQYFIRQRVAADAEAIGDDLWGRYMRAAL